MVTRTPAKGDGHFQHDASTSILLGCADEPMLVHTLTMAEVQFGGDERWQGRATWTPEAPPYLLRPTPQ